MELGEKIIVADDESRITSLVGDFLSAAGYKPVLASDGAEALAAFSENRDAAAVILDIMMPELNGWEVCREIRKQSSVPIILLTARAADEYVTKPFSPAVLVKRVEALIRRSKTREQDGDRGLRIEREAFVAYLDGKELELTVKEFEILNHLFENKGRVFSRDQILAAVWGYDFEGDPRTVDSHVARLRLKLGDYGNMHIKTVYGLGYKFEV